MVTTITSTRTLAVNSAFMQEIKDGNPNLTKAIHQLQRACGSEEDIYESIYNARAGMMPAWVNRLSPQTLRQLAIYVHELGGGEESSAQDRMEDNMEGIEAEDEPATGTDE